MMTDETLLNYIRQTLFNTTASRYDSHIMPAFGPLAEALLQVATPQSDDRVLDLGTATGAVALHASPSVQHVAGVDFAPAMLPLAQKNIRQRRSHNVTLYQGDVHRLPHPTDTFSLALSSLSLNNVDPQWVLPEVLRVLQPGGRFVFQEWGIMDEASKIVKKTFKAYRVETAEGTLADFRRLGETPRAWDQLGGADDIAQFLRQVGFSEIKVLHTTAAIPLDPLTFYQFRTAWAPYQAELSAMTADNQARLQAEIISQLTAWAEPDGCFIWQPELLQMVAWKEK